MVNIPNGMRPGQSQSILRCSTSARVRETSFPILVAGCSAFPLADASTRLSGLSPLGTSDKPTDELVDEGFPVSRFSGIVLIVRLCCRHQYSDFVDVAPFGIAPNPPGCETWVRTTTGGALLFQNTLVASPARGLAAVLSGQLSNVLVSGTVAAHAVREPSSQRRQMEQHASPCLETSNGFTSLCQTFQSF